MPSTLLPLCVYLKRCFGKCTGTSFIDATSIKVCHNRRIPRNRVFQDLAACTRTFEHSCHRSPVNFGVIELKYLCPSKSEAVLYQNIGLGLDGECHSNLVLANVKSAKEPWAVVTDEDPTLQTLWQ